MDARLCGLITKVEVRLSQKDKTPWARMTLEDMTGSIEALVFQPLYGELPRPLAVGDVVVVSGQIDLRDEQPKLRTSQVLWLPEACEQLLTTLVLRLPLGDWLDPARWAQLRELVMDTPGPVKLRLLCTRANGAENDSIELAPADHYGVMWTPELRAKLDGFLGADSYELRAKPTIARAKRKPWQQRGTS
jgi:DNA polymerase III alpha subunit